MVLLGFAAPAFATCSALGEAKLAMKSAGATWVEMRKDQWEFLRGVSVLNPQTPPGLPLGDRAVLTTLGGVGKVIFIDGVGREDQLLWVAWLTETEPEFFRDCLREFFALVIPHERHAEAAHFGERFRFALRLQPIRVDL